MVATAARIGFISSEFRVVTSGPDSTVVAKYGATARDTPEPIETFFVDKAHAQVMADERLTLLSPDRRRAVMICSGIHGLPATMPHSPTTPVVTVIDDERALNRAAAVVEIGPDFERNRTTFGTWG